MVSHHYFCTARCGGIAIVARRKSAFGGKPGEPWPEKATCPRCGADAYGGATTYKDGSARELYDEWQSILHGYHDRYLREHGLPPAVAEAPRLDSSRIYLLVRGQVRDVTERFRIAVT